MSLLRIAELKQQLARRDKRISELEPAIAQPADELSDTSILNICSRAELIPLRKAGDFDQLLICFARTILAAQPVQPTNHNNKLMDAIDAVLSNQEHAFSGGMCGYQKGSPTWQIYEDLRIAQYNIAQPVQPGLAERIQREIDHCVMNDLRLAPYFGKRQGELAVRVSALEAILETSAQPTPPESTK